MRIIRYSLEIVKYQQLQPLWPGSVLHVGGRRYRDDGSELIIPEYGIDIWCYDNDERRGDRLPPVLGIWIVSGADEIDPAMFEADALFHGTVDMRDAGRGVHHVFSSVVGHAETVEPPVPKPEYGSVDDLLESLKARHAGRRQQ